MNARRSAAIAVVILGSFSAASAASQAVLPPVRIAGLFGESDEEKAARLKAEQHEADQDAAINELRQRVQDLTQALTQTTGQNEQLTHRLLELGQRIDRQQKDFDYKLCTLAAQQLGAGTSTDGGGLPCDPGSALTTLTSPAAAAPQKPAASGTLGTLPANAAALPRSQYDEALNLLARARYDEARAAFRAYADANPKDPLTPQAVYWTGKIAYVQKDYAGAAQSFAEQLKRFPSSPQAAESMLKLGQSLIALGEKKEGCLTLGAIKTKYKQAPDAILTEAATTRAKTCQ